MYHAQMHPSDADYRSARDEGADRSTLLMKLLLHSLNRLYSYPGTCEACKELVRIYNDSLAERRENG